MIGSRSLCALLGLCVFASPLFAQRGNDNLTYGMQAGGTYSVINDLETTILSEPYYINYSLSRRWQPGFTAGGFIDYKAMHSIVVLGAAVSYARQGSELYFVNSAQDFNYTMKFNYQYINILPQVKLFPGANPDEPYADGFYVALGMQIGLNVAPDNITYRSGGPGYLAAFGPDLQQQQQLRNVLKGKTDFGPSLGLGWKFQKGWAIEGRFFYGVTDVVETEANSYNFIENKNSNMVGQLSFSYDFSRLGKEK